jgi:hypothetical protein
MNEFQHRAMLKSNSVLPVTRKLNLEKVIASLNTPCPKCGYEIPPAELGLSVRRRTRGVSKKGQAGRPALL